jgi:hypothetical protein
VKSGIRRFMYSWKDNLKTFLEGIGCEGVHGIKLAQGKSIVGLL